MKKILIGLFAVAFGCSVYAFSTSKEAPQEKHFQTTYVYMGDNTLAQQRLEENYVKDEDALPCDEGNAVICQIVADDAGTHPDFSSGNPVDEPWLFSIVKKP
ncbi:MAG: hypothetical protein ACO1OO_04385 [Flavisolibacter sp.]